MSKCHVVEFLKSVPPYHVGERAGFTDIEWVEKSASAGHLRIIERNKPIVDPETIEKQRRALAEEREETGRQPKASARAA